MQKVSNRSRKSVRGAMEILKRTERVKEYADLDALAKAYGMNPEVSKTNFC